jgi:hypothetical protein
MTKNFPGISFTEVLIQYTIKICDFAPARAKLMAAHYFPAENLNGLEGLK